MGNLISHNVETRGISMGPGGSITANQIVNVTNPPPARTEVPATTKSSFRFNIPTPTEHFKGRMKTLEAVRDYFNILPPQTDSFWKWILAIVRLGRMVKTETVQADNCWKRTVAIVGFGGMGKTETAYKFAAEFKETFPNVAWINAETEKSALASFLGLAKCLKLVPHYQKEADLDLVRRVYRHIDEHDYGRPLFIFDNAIRLHPGEKEFGIIEYLPTDDLENKRFPCILITTQTHDWERRIKTIQVDELSAEESLEFFRTTFRIQSAECDDLFEELHNLFEGYPLVMNLAASQIDYSPNNGKVHQLRHQIQKYIGQLKKEQSKLLNEKFNRAWPTKYHKTLSNVWELTFERFKLEHNGPDALKILQYMSFLHVPIRSRDVIHALEMSSDCPLPAKTERCFQMKELFRLLERFYTARILYATEETDDKYYNCTLGIHRLIQLVVRQQMDSTEDLESVLFCLARDCKIDPDQSLVNKSALEEVLQRSQLSQRALPYVGILACKGYPAACKIVETRQPETEAAATIWRLYSLERGITCLRKNVIQILQELVGLTKSEERHQDRCFFTDITIKLLTDKYYLSHQRDDRIKVPGFFHLDCMKGVEGLVTDFILNVRSVQDLGCSCDSRYCTERNERLLHMTVMLSQTFIREDATSLILTTDVIARTWFASFDRLRYIRDQRYHRVFWENMYKSFHMRDASQTRIAMLRTGLWDHGLAEKLIQIFYLVSCEWDFLVACMDVCMDGVDLKDERVQTVISSFCQMLAGIEFPTTLLYDQIHLAVHSCSIWIKLLLIDGDPPSQMLLQFLSSSKFLDCVQRSVDHDYSLPYSEDGHPFSDAVKWIPEKYHAEYFPKFIQRFSSSNIKEIQTLLHFCRRFADRYGEGYELGRRVQVIIETAEGEEIPSFILKFKNSMNERDD